MKKAIIVPMLKKGTTSNVVNYRPILLTCVASKIIERVIVKCIYEYDHLQNNHLLCEIQHSFMTGYKLA